MPRISVFLDPNIKDHIVIKRMLPYWEKWGIAITSPQNANIHLSSVIFGTETSLPKVLRLDGIYYDSKTDYTLENLPLREAYKRADGIIYQSKFVENIVPHYLGDTSAKTTRIYNGVDPWLEHKEEEIFHIVVMSTWRRWKRLKEMVEIFAEFSRKHNAILHIIGRTNEFIWPYANVIYHRQLTYEQMGPILELANVTLHLGKRDSCPNSLIELLAVGIPAIVSDCGGGAAELASLVKGCIVCQGDVDLGRTSPESIYEEKWNELDPLFKSNVLKALEEIYEDRRRVQIPKRLTAERMAQAYGSFMGDIYGMD